MMSPETLQNITRQLLKGGHINIRQEHFSRTCVTISFHVLPHLSGTINHLAHMENLQNDKDRQAANLTHHLPQTHTCSLGRHATLPGDRNLPTNDSVTEPPQNNQKQKEE